MSLQRRHSSAPRSSSGRLISLKSSLQLSENPLLHMCRPNSEAHAGWERPKPHFFTLFKLVSNCVFRVYKPMWRASRAKTPVTVIGVSKTLNILHLAPLHQHRPQVELHRCWPSKWRKGRQMPIQKPSDYGACTKRLAKCFSIAYGAAFLKLQEPCAHKSLGISNSSGRSRHIT